MSAGTEPRLPFCDFEAAKGTDYSFFPDTQETLYEYKPLTDSASCIRVVELHETLWPVYYEDGHGKHDEATISLSVRQVSLPEDADESKEPPSYDALSYVWGDTSDPAAIVIDGQLKFVTRSLYTALRYIWQWTFEPVHDGMSKAVGFGKPVWIDALCINQEDLAEKSQQIQRMGDIYSHAAAVYVWIEPRSDGLNDSICQTLFFMDARLTWEYDPCPPREDGSIMMSDVDKTLELESSRSRLFEVLDIVMDGLSGDDYANLDQLVAFSEHPYWARAWIVQELALAKHNKAIILHGNTLAAFHNFVNSIHTLNVIMYLVNHQRAWPKYETWSQVRLMQLRLAFVKLHQIESQARAERMSLAALIPRAIFRPTKATLAVDHIYSLLPLAEDFSTCGIVPDYEKTVTEVYRETMEYLLGALGASALTFCEICQASMLGLPSWVVNFSRHGFMTLKLPSAYSSTSTRLYSAGGDPTAFQWRIDGLKLCISGRRVDCIACLRQMPVLQDIEEESSANTWNNKTTWLRAFDNFINHATEIHRAKETDAWRVPIADRNSPAVSLKAMRAPDSMKSAYEELLRGRPESESGVQYAQIMPIAGQTRAPFVTASGHLGVAPRCARVGDSVWAIDGADTLTILRRVDEETNDYFLVGECYMNGFMDGEALSGGIPGEKITII